MVIKEYNVDNHEISIYENCQDFVALPVQIKENNVIHRLVTDDISYSKNPTTIRKHSRICFENQISYIYFRLSFPNSCLTCHASSKISWEENCPNCFNQNKCPRCKNKLNNHNCCLSCGWNPIFLDTTMPILECICPWN